MTLKLVTKDYGSEISWEFGNCFGPTSSQPNPYQSDTTYDDIECCQSLGSYILLCRDSYGDGWHGGYIEIDGTKYCEDFTSGHTSNGKVVTISAG